MALLRDLESSPIVQSILSKLQHAGVKDVTAGLLLVSAAVFTASYLVPLFYSLFFSPLRKIPGPLLARVTRWYEYRLVIKGDSNRDYMRLHKKYGSSRPGC